MTDPTPPEGLPEATPPDEQLGLFGSESNAPIAPTRKGRQRQSALQRAGLDEERTDSFKLLMASLKAKKADQLGYRLSIGAIYKAGFGKAIQELYDHFGIENNQRAALPVRILRILIVYELAAQRRIERHIVQGQNQTEINRELAQQCRIATTIMRRALYYAERPKDWKPLPS